MELDQYLGRTLSWAGLEMDEVQDALTYGDRRAWAIFYRGSDCKLQFCWSARNGGFNFMLAPLDAPNEFGLSNQSRAWQAMLRLSDAHDQLKTPGMSAGDNEIMAWLKDIFEIHFGPARAALLAEERPR
ncbi:hypothetical protein [Mycolicibacter heraklionensis]|uniref:hypothetical protein n=1 Tax=Mycolicibacter heraklionensis TaxID=512402 RepID=UPI002AAF3416|nr:hypothetical protein [Mycolicibacter heraklionensis]